MIDISDVRIEHVHGHYEVIVGGRFFCSADTIAEAVHELRGIIYAN